jgi:acyl-coenzyme A thioesterase PaaI-like protein
MSDEPLGKEVLQERLAQSPFISLLNLTVLSADPVKQQLVMRAAMRPEFERGRGSGQWHGGPIAAIIDTVGDYALVMLLGR